MTKEWMAREHSRQTGTQNYCRSEKKDEGTLEKVNPNTCSQGSSEKVTVYKKDFGEGTAGETR